MCIALVIEDSVSCTLSMQHVLARAVSELNKLGVKACPSLELKFAKSLREADAALDVTKWDVILLDLTLVGAGGSTGAEDALRWVDAHTRRPDFPAVIILTGETEGEHERQSFEAGAQNYWVKTDLMNYPMGFVRAMMRSIWRKNDSVKRYGS